jgi:hypothetical protein
MIDHDVEIAPAWLLLDIALYELRAEHDGDEMKIIETLPEQHRKFREARHQDHPE